MLIRFFINYDKTICLNEYLNGIEAYLECNYKGINFVSNLEDLNGNVGYYYDTLKNVITNENDSNTQNTEDSIGGTKEKKEINQETTEISQMEQDALFIKKSINFINPVEGTITSTFGWRNPTTSTVPKYHTGLDIANISGTPIYSSTDGRVILSSAEGDYRQSFKNTN